MIAFRLLVVGIISSASILLTPSRITIAQTQLAPQEVSAIAKAITVRIDGISEGSGVIIAKSGNTYTVLTNWHVVEASGQYIVKTSDGQEHSVDYSQIQKLPDDVDIDLALVKFTSNIEYKIAQLGESDKLVEGQTIHLAGYPGSGQIHMESDRFYRFDNLSINAILPNSREGGYSLAYGGENFSGMSGSPILNSNGYVIGINGTAYVDVDGKARSNYAIPINTYTELASLAYSVQSEFKPQATEESNNFAFRHPIVVIDPGHGGQDPGAIGIGGVNEKDLVLPIAKKVATLLNKHGVRTILTRRENVFISLEGRVNHAKQVNANIFVSIHVGATNLSRPDVNGLETYYYQSGRHLAEIIHWSILNGVEIENRSIRQARFYVLRHLDIPSVSLNLGFLTGSVDAVNLKNKSYQAQAAESIASGIVKYINTKTVADWDMGK